jgi:hypothetical protein
VISGTNEVLVVAVAGLNRRIHAEEASILREMERLLAPFRLP